MSQHGKRSSQRFPAPAPAPRKSFVDIEDLQRNNRSKKDFHFTPDEAEGIKYKLLDWYDKNHRVLPWRQNLHSQLHLCVDKSCTTNNAIRNKDRAPRKSKRQKPIAEKIVNKMTFQREKPESKFQTQEELAYAVWVSEVMLQQTRVENVIPYFERWMVKWPSLQDLANANQEEVNSLWAGLGYYRRARFLLEGAKYLSEKLGTIPQHASKLQEIPGVGKYTANAIASIAFRQPVPVVDGNVIRVLCRLRAISSSIKASTTIDLLWELAGQLVDQNRPGDLNQALMELGATACTKYQPACSSCPISSHCKALALVAQHERKVTEGNINDGSTNAFAVTDFPAKVIKASPRREYAAVCILEVTLSNPMVNTASKSLTGRPLFLLVQRPLVGLLAGLWEFPSAVLVKPNASVEMRTAAIDSYLLQSLGIHVGADGYVVKSRQEIGQYTHLFTHIRLHMFIEWLQICADPAILSLKLEGEHHIARKWVDANQLANLGLTSGVRKIHTMLSKFQEAKNS